MGAVGNPKEQSRILEDSWKFHGTLGNPRVGNVKY
jgi:hypothetical protein